MCLSSQSPQFVTLSSFLYSKRIQIKTNNEKQYKRKLCRCEKEKFLIFIFPVDHKFFVINYYDGNLEKLKRTEKNTAFKNEKSVEINH